MENTCRLAFFFCLLWVGTRGQRMCAFGGFRCPTSGQCLAEWQLCDGVENCFDGGEDESYEFARCGLPSSCPTRNESKVHGRYCRRDCSNRRCGGPRKSCMCDGNCGMSCYNKEAPCKAPPIIPRASGYLVLRFPPEGGHMMEPVESPPYKYGDVLEYICPLGYAAEGPEITCNSNRDWTHATVVCALVCPYDYRLVERYDLRCGEDCVTSVDCPGSESCVCDGPCGRTCVDREADCVDAPPLPNAQVEYAGLGIERRANYFCNHGFFATAGDSTHACSGGSRKFYGNPLNCIEVRCGHPARRLRDRNLMVEPRLSQSNYKRVNTTVRFGCKRGYLLLGSANRTCQANGRWSGLPPACRNLARANRECPDPGLPVNGWRSGDNFGEGQTVRFGCEIGFVMEGSDSIICLQSLEWSDGGAPKCFDPRYPRNTFEALSSFSETIDVLPTDSHRGGRSIDLKYDKGLEIAFVIDCSPSMAKQEFTNAIRFAKKLVERMESYSNAVNFGIIVFASEAKAVLDLSDEVSDIATVIKKLDEVKTNYSAKILSNNLKEGTKTNKALLLLSLQLADTFLRYPDRKRHIFICTDGLHNEGGDPVKTKDNMESNYNDKIEFYSVSSCKECVNRNWPRKQNLELINLASKPANYIHLESYYLLYKSLDKVFNSTFDYSECGQAGDDRSILKEKRGGRVIAGKAAERAWPWQAFIFLRGRSLHESMKNGLKGGGSLINDKWVLTAAHVTEVIADQYNAFAVGLGFFELPVKKWDKRNHNPKAERFFQPCNIIQHNNYNRDFHYDFDVALIRIGKELVLNSQRELVPSDDGFNGRVPLSPYVRPVCLPCSGGCLNRAEMLNRNGQPMISDNDSPKVLCQKEVNWLLDDGNDKTTIIATGFGHMEVVEGDNIPKVLASNKLQQVEQKLLSRQNCSANVERMKDINKEFTEEMICATFKGANETADTCVGDSGGPLVRKVVNSQTGETCWVQIGIVSWSYGCGYVRDGERFPGYYANVPRLASWINNTMNEHDVCE